MTTAAPLTTTSSNERKPATSKRHTDTTTHNIKILGFDGGNRYVKAAIDPHAPLILPSVRAFLDPDQETDKEPESVTIAYKMGPCHEVEGKRYVVGLQAAELQGECTMQGEKADIAPSLLLAAAGKFAIAPTTRIEKVLVALPDDRNDNESHAIASAIVGTHTLEVDGALKTLQIMQVEVRVENQDAYRWVAYSDGLPEGKTNGIVDVGGGNVTAALFSARGKLLRETRLVQSGAIAIARKIAQHRSMLGLEPKGNSPRLDRILNAIAAGDFKYGNTGHCFLPVYQEFRQQWENTIRKAIKTAWQDWVGEIGKIAIVGGGAEMLRPVETLTKGVFFVASDPQTATVRGMVL